MNIKSFLTRTAVTKCNKSYYKKKLKLYTTLFRLQKSSLMLVLDLNVNMMFTSFLLNKLTQKSFLSTTTNKSGALHKSAKHRTLYVNVPWNLRICKWENNFRVRYKGKNTKKWQCWCQVNRTPPYFIFKFTSGSTICQHMFIFKHLRYSFIFFFEVMIVKNNVQVQGEQLHVHQFEI